MTLENRKTILLVEDEVLIAAGKKVELQKYGYNIILANTGEKAVDAVRENAEIALILMDIDLGKGIDGTEAAELILRERHIPVVFLSSHIEPEIVEKTEKITSYGYVVKSSSITVLDASIKMAFRLFDANMKIDASDRKQKTMLSNISDVIGIMGSDGVMKYKSPNIQKWFGWDPDEIVGTSGFHNVHPGDLEKAEKVFEELLRADKATTTFDLRYRCKDGSFKPIELTAVNLIGDPVINGVLLNFRDITEQLQDEEKIREKDVQFRKLSASLPDMIFQFTRRPDGSYCVPVASEGIKNVFGCSPEEVTDDFEPIGRVLHPEDSERVLRAIENSAAKLVYFTSEFRVQIPGKPVQWIYSRSVPEQRPDGSVTWYGFCANITELKETEQALRKNEEHLRVTLQSIGDAVITADMKGRISNMNQVAEDLTGWKLEDAFGLPFSDVFRIINSEDGTPVSNPVDEVLRTGQSVSLAGNTVLVANDNSRYQIADSASPIRDQNNEIIGVVLVFRDVTREYRVIKALERSETQYRLLFEATIEGICLHEIVYDESHKAADYRILDANSRFEEILNLKREDVIGKLATEVYQTAEAPYLDLYASVAGTGVTDRFEVYFAPMKKHFLISVFSPARGRFATIFEDITERKNTEIALRESMDDLRESQRIAHVGSWRLNLATDEVTWSEELYKMYDFDPALPPPRYKEMDKIFTADSWNLLSKSLTRTAETGVPYELELETVTKDGGNGWMWVHGEAEYNKEGEISSIHGAAQDITGRKLAEQEISRQLIEKELILKESHHRIKNNLTAIAGLLTMQAQSADNHEVKSDLNVAIGRVNGMRMLYEKLLLTDNYKTPPVESYMTNLIDEIINLQSNRIILKIERKIDDVPLDSSRLFQMGLIVNELMTNIMKYAFEGRESGLVVISLQRKDSEIVLEIQDDGRGLPEGFDIDSSKGFGLKLIKMLSDQLGGSFSIEENKGTRSVVKIPAL